ncbi:alpha/beta hydrolase [Paramylibacter kogurei]|uniref:alpha/beta hydrolase n=1 Tax=Paramylibacter kogurei TaxID=1889778 RepID=UPI00105593F4|nr:hypothetical protein [Amylibacter kogurei]
MQRFLFHPTPVPIGTNNTLEISNDQSDGIIAGRFFYEQRGDLTPKPPSNSAYSPRIFGDQRFSTRFDGKSRVWRGFGKRSNTLKPAIVLLHGAKRSGASMLDMWQGVSRRNDVVLIAPDSFGASWSRENDTEEFLAHVLAEADEKYGIDPERIYLFGHSSGAIHAQEIANGGSLKWVAVGAHAGTPYWRNFTPRKDAPAVKIFLGSRDHNFPMGQALASAQKLAENGHDVYFTEIPNHTHWYYIIGQRLSDETWEFFQSQTNG